MQISVDYYPLSCSVRTGRLDEGHNWFSELRERLERKSPTLPVRLAYTDNNIGGCPNRRTLCVRRGCNYSMSSQWRIEMYDPLRDKGSI